MAPVLLAAALATLQGYVFRETDGAAPRRPMTVELLREGRSVHRETTQPNGTFEFPKVREGLYTIRGRYNDFVVLEEAVAVSAPGPNFAALMTPKRRAGTGPPFGTVSVAQLAARNDRDHQKKLREAGRLTKSRNFAAAAGLYEETLTKHPSAEAFDTLALLYLQLGRTDEAFGALEKAIAHDPSYLFPYMHLAAVYLEDRRYKDLLTVATQALQMDPKWVTGYVYLGQAHAGLGDLEAAARAVQTASDLVRGKAPGPHLLLARIAWERKDCGRAREHLDRYLALHTSARAAPDLQKSVEMLAGCH
jgi:tetratricopeptide (TPR) repeat protein